MKLLIMRQVTGIRGIQVIEHPVKSIKQADFMSKGFNKPTDILTVMNDSGYIIKTYGRHNND